jgi:hypothetical protein
MRIYFASVILATQSASSSVATQCTRGSKYITHTNWRSRRRDQMILVGSQLQSLIVQPALDVPLLSVAPVILI